MITALLAAVLLQSSGPAAAAPEPLVQMIGEGVVSTPVNEFGGVVVNKGRELYFSASVHRSYRYGMYVSKRDAKGRWSSPELLPFSGKGRDFDMVFSPDGETMYFTSDRPLPGRSAKGYHLWKSVRGQRGWGDPTPLPEPINRPSKEQNAPTAHEWFISAAADGTLYLTSADREGGMGAADIYVVRPRADGSYEAPVNLGAVINTAGFESEAVIAPDQSFLVFSAEGRKDGYGDWDIYISRRSSDGSWTPPENLGPLVNGAERDYSPRLDADGHTLYFTSERHFASGTSGRIDVAELHAGHASVLNGYGNLYKVDLRSLPAGAFLKDR